MSPDPKAMFTQFTAALADPTIAGRTPEGRTVVRNPDGTTSSERTITIGVDEGFVNIPTMFRGQQFSPEQAAEIMRKNKFIDPDTGRKLPFFKSQEEAVRAAGVRTEYLGGRR